jgi:hypothetical protein
MRITHLAGALMPIALTACSGGQSGTTDTQPPKQAAQFTYIVDRSSSPATMNDPAVAQAAQRRIGADVTRHAALGDVITVYESGARSADRMIAHPPIVTGYELRIPAARTQVTKQLGEITNGFQAQGGDNATNLLLTLETIRPNCTPRSTVTLISDGVEESDSYSAAKALRSSVPVKLPPPPGPYLTGCRFQIIGLGLTGDPKGGKPQLLPAQQLNSLRQGWTTYLQAAGVLPDDIEFVSIL